MSFTRTDNSQLKTAAADLRANLERLRPLLQPILVTNMTDEQRKEIPKPPLRMFEAARDVANNAGPFMGKFALVDYDPAAVLEDLDNLSALSGLSELLGELKRWIEDSELRFSSEAFGMTLKAYDLGKLLIEEDGSYRPIVEPVAEVYAARKKHKKEGSSEASPQGAK